MKKILLLVLSVLMLSGAINAEARRNVIFGGDGCVSEVTFKDGDKELGSIKNRDVKGVIPEGPVKEYYQSGKVLSEANYFKGKLNGAVKKYYESGAKMAELTYADGKRVERLKIYDEKGVPFVDVDAESPTGVGFSINFKNDAQAVPERCIGFRLKTGNYGFKKDAEADLEKKVIAVATELASLAGISRSNILPLESEAAKNSSNSNKIEKVSFGKKRAGMQDGNYSEDKIYIVYGLQDKTPEQVKAITEKLSSLGAQDVLDIMPDMTGVNYFYSSGTVPMLGAIDRLPLVAQNEVNTVLTKADQKMIFFAKNAVIKGQIDKTLVVALDDARAKFDVIKKSLEYLKGEYMITVTESARVAAENAGVKISVYYTLSYKNTDVTPRVDPKLTSDLLVDIKIDGVEYKDGFQDGEDLKKPAEGSKFVILNTTVVNIGKKEIKGRLGMRMRLVDDKGYEHDLSPIKHNQLAIIFKDVLQPEGEKKIKFVFEMSKDRTAKELIGAIGGTKVNYKKTITEKKEPKK